MSNCINNCLSQSESRIFLIMKKYIMKRLSLKWLYYSHYNHVSGTEGGLRLYLDEIVQITCPALSSQAWPVKSQAANTISSIASKLGEWKYLFIQFMVPKLHSYCCYVPQAITFYQKSAPEKARLKNIVYGVLLARRHSDHLVQLNL